jgi:D-sedoheptulose 7-phosphate isomerase
MEIKKQINESIRIKEKLLADEKFTSQIKAAIHMLVETNKSGGKILFCGNGGSAADAQHLAAELSGRFYIDRPPINAEALHVNSSFVTATANDYSFDAIYERMVQAAGQKDDTLLAFSTSGKSPNIIRALKAARTLGLKTIGFTGESGGDMTAHCDLLFKIPSKDTPRIQEMHILIGHIICENVESILFKK